MKTRLMTVLAMSFAVSAAVGCGKIKQQKECAEVIKTINAGVTRAKAANLSSPAGFKQFAEAYETTGQEAAKLSVTDPELKKQVDEYVVLTKEIAKAARDAAEPAKLPMARKEISAAAAKENALVNKMNTTCMRK
ncbi:MAG: hypothetical protein IT374_17805 [Polyangiaceae bacterium]|nr:hypothetical protein [Polyangiaceae bacterium]